MKGFSDAKLPGLVIRPLTLQFLGRSRPGVSMSEKTGLFLIRSVHEERIENPLQEVSDHHGLRTVSTGAEIKGADARKTIHWRAAEGRGMSHEQVLMLAR